jgi:hypothetical protein
MRPIAAVILIACLIHPATAQPAKKPLTGKDAAKRRAEIEAEQAKLQKRLTELETELEKLDAADRVPPATQREEAARVKAAMTTLAANVELGKSVLAARLQLHKELFRCGAIDSTYFAAMDHTGVGGVKIEPGAVGRLVMSGKVVKTAPDGALLVAIPTGFALGGQPQPLAVKNYPTSETTAGSSVTLTGVFEVTEVKRYEGTATPVVELVTQYPAKWTRPKPLTIATQPAGPDGRGGPGGR